MKKLLSLIMALAVVFTAGMFSRVNKTEVKALNVGYEEVGLGFGAYAKINAQTGCYDFVLYAVAREENGAIPTFSNYNINVSVRYAGRYSKDSDEGGQVREFVENFKCSFTSNLSGNVLSKGKAFYAELKETGEVKEEVVKDEVVKDEVGKLDDSSGSSLDYYSPGFRCNIIFNGDANADFSKGAIIYGADENNELNLNRKSYLLPIGLISTNASPIQEQYDNVNTFSDLYVMYSVESVGYMKGNRVIAINYSFGDIGCRSQLIADFDLDGQITVKDLITAQYYLINEQNSIYDGVCINNMMGDLNYDTNSLQYLKMFLSEKISFGEMIGSIAIRSMEIEREHNNYDSSYYGSY